MHANYFELYGIPVSFYPDEGAVRKAYLRLSKELHPDLQAVDDETQLASITQTAENNKAYKTLNDSNLRIRYVLELLGHSIDEQDKLPPDFLMEMMDWNERIEEVDEENSEQVEAIVKDFNELSASLLNQLEQQTRMFDQNQDSGLLNSIKEICLKQKYLLRLKESMDTFAGR